MEKLGKKRLLLTDDQRRRLAVKAKVLGRKALQEITTIFTPYTLLRCTASWWRRNGTIVIGDEPWAGLESERRSLNWSSG
jgi:hypothetical protein